MAVATWTQDDIDALRKAMRDGVLEVEFDGPPRRKVRYQDLTAMDKQLAKMVSAVCGSDAPSFRLATTRRGFRNGR